MKSTKSMPFRHLLLILILSIVASMIAAGSEQSREAIQKDYRNVLKEKKPEKQIKKHRDLVNKWKEKGYLEDLIPFYEADVETERANAGLHYGLGYAYANQGRIDLTQTVPLFERAANQFEQTIVLDPTLSQAHFSLGAVYQAQNRLELAAQAMAACLNLNPKYYPAHYRLGEIQLQQDNPEAALESFRAAQKMNSKWAHPYYGIGVAHFTLGNDHAAREALKEAIRHDSELAPAYFKLGQVLAKEGLFNEAWRAYETGEKYQPYTTENLYELGTIFVQAGNQAGAINIFRHIIDGIDSTHTDVLLQLGELYYATGEEATAIEHYKRAIETDTSLKNYFMEQLAPYHAGLMGRNEAKSILKRFLAVLPDDPRATFHYAQIEAETGNLTIAIQYFEKTIALLDADETHLDIEFAPEHLLDTYRFLGDAYYQQENHEQARTSYQRTIELDPGLERYFFNQGKSAFDAEQFDLALEPFSKFLLIYPADIETTYLLGRSHEALGNTENAQRLYARTLELDPNHTDVLMRSARIYRDQNDPQSALTMLTKLIGIEPTNVDAHYLSGKLYIELGHSEEALDAFLETIHLDVNRLDAHYQIVALYEQQGDIDNIIKRYETIIRLDSSTADPFLRLGALYLRQGDKDSVVRVYEPGLEIEPDHPQAQYNLGIIFEERDEIQKAIKHFELANRYDDGNFDWHFRYARLLDRHAETLEDYHTYAATAVEEYTKTIDLKDDYASAYLYRGLITRRYKQIGDTLYRYGQIVEDFKRAIALEPNNSDAHYYLGMTYVDLDQREEAKEILLKTLQFKKQYKAVYLQLGLIAEGEGDHAKAITHFEKELEIDPESVRAYQRLGDLYSNYSTDFGRAKETLEKALALQPNHVSTLLSYASTLYYLDQLGAATEQFETVVQINPKNLTANYNLALMYEYTGKTQQAINRWKKFLELDPPPEWKADAEQHLRELQP